MDVKQYSTRHYKTLKPDDTYSRFIMGLLMILTSVLPAWAQFRVVDAKTHEPIQGAFVINKEGNTALRPIVWHQL